MAAPSHSKLVSDGSELRLFPVSSSFDDPDVVEVSSSAAAAWGSGKRKRKDSQLSFVEVDPRDVIEIVEDDDYNEDVDHDAVVIIGESKPNYKNKQPIENDKYLLKQVKDSFSSGPVGSSKKQGSMYDAQFDVGLFDLNYVNGIEYDPFDYDEDDDYEYDDELAEIIENSDSDAKFDGLDLPPGMEAPLPCLQKSTTDEIDLKYRLFKKFDTVQDHSDHHFKEPHKTKNSKTIKKPSKDWVKHIQHEWRVLEKDLPESIYVRIYEDRMDILRAAIVGPAGTPYHDGIFFFDIYFPPSYPHVPPLVHYHSGGLRLNPNLYACGKVCLSLLNTWSGNGCEKWNPSNSTMLQVLVSIQALVLNAKPYFNEPGFASTANTYYGEKNSLVYNEETFLLSCKTMLYSLRRPPMHFEDLVAGHFSKYGRNILVACKAYIGGAQIGCLVGDGIQDVDEGDKSCSSAFKSSLKKLFNDLLMEFRVKGVDCDEFLALSVKGAATAVDTALTL